MHTSTTHGHLCFLGVWRGMVDQFASGSRMSGFKPEQLFYKALFCNLTAWRNVQPCTQNLSIRNMLTFAELCENTYLSLFVLLSTLNQCDPPTKTNHCSSKVVTLKIPVLYFKVIGENEAFHKIWLVTTFWNMHTSLLTFTFISILNFIFFLLECNARIKANGTFIFSPDVMSAYSLRTVA